MHIACSLKVKDCTNPMTWRDKIAIMTSLEEWGERLVEAGEDQHEGIWALKCILCEKEDDC